MTDSHKRKQAFGDGKTGPERRDAKRSKGGSNGKWQTPHQKAKLASRGSGKIEPGDVGIWATCARGQEGRATEELISMLEEYAERFYGIHSDLDGEDEDVSVDDIEASIQKEVASMGDKQSTKKLFSPVHLDLQCVLFFKTRPPIDPVDFVHKICQEILSKPGIRRMRYANRLTPMALIGKATEKGLEEVGKHVLGTHFNLAESNEHSQDDKKLPSYTYAIRPTTRNHSNLKRDDVIKQVASMISHDHKVDLTAPDRTIIVEIYQTVCGMSVVGSDWDKLKRFNLAELYSLHKQDPKVKAPSNGDAKPQIANTDEVGP